MARRFVVTGTDTGVGKTTFCAGIVGFLDAYYWKPIQAGLRAETDSEVVKRLAELPNDRIVPERYRLETPASPHLAAELDRLHIDATSLNVPDTGKRPLVIEGAGGLMVPLNRNELYIDVFARWRVPVILCARTALGTINHSLLSLEALHNRNIDIRGIVFIGEENVDTETTICRIGKVRKLGRLSCLVPLTAYALRAAFKVSFHGGDFDS
ncbi:dethiobiotin synthase [Bradyrhizobium sp. NBAIM01]|uniref:dethiobiotin synthase n=1 Tax=Bradyrhizobium sp. NBAIM01 TaxID=2793818 RepID=UPI001CD595E8|nr:dethiobiotin synthase [Bradyrhizobium sp. NBAIM01]MCA1512728.1 ATP-dependent dethiobiotin synthetase BioD [Bradyrhizobium sp. NBAIM01]